MRNAIKQNTTLILLIIGVTVLLVAVCVFSISNIAQSQHEERVGTSNTLMSKIGHHVESSVDLNWNKAHYMARRLSAQQPYESLEDVLQAMASREQDFYTGSNEKLLLIDSEGKTYASDGTTFQWMDMSLLREEGDVMVLADKQLIADGVQRIHLLSELPTPIQVDDIEFTHLSMLLPMSKFDVCFDVDSFGEGTAAFILRSNGTPVYRQENSDSFEGVYNVLSALASAEFHYGSSMDKVTNDIEQGQGDTVNLVYKGVNYVVSYYPLAVNNWVAMILVPENYAAADMNVFTRNVVVNVVLVFTAVGIALAAIIYKARARIRTEQNQVNQQLKKAAEAERAANEAKTKFLSSMSHDIRTPMNTIVGMTDLAIKRLDDMAYVNECLHRINLASNHLLMLINDILDISKVESGKMVLSPETFSVHELVEGLSNIAQPLAQEKGIDFTLEVRDIEHEYLLGDTLRLNQVFINLLSNAVKFTPAGGYVKAELREEPLEGTSMSARLVFVVTDNGIGMGEDFQENMYDVFSREEDGRINQNTGSGLGLAICRQMVDLMEGTIDCESKEGEGTSFKVVIDLPCGEQRTEQLQSRNEETNLAGMNLLVAEDNEMNWMVLEAILEMHDITASLAENGQVCLDMLNAAEPNTYDAVLMDVRMPVMGGCKATRLLRQSDQEWIRRIPVVVQTADAYAEDIQECMDAGMNYHISKPIDTAKLIDVLSEIRNKQ